MRAIEFVLIVFTRAIQLYFHLLLLHSHCVLVIVVFSVYNRVQLLGTAVQKQHINILTTF